MKQSTFPLRDFLRENEDVEYNLASSSVRDISIFNDGEYPSSFDTGYTDEYDLKLQKKLSKIYKGVEVVPLPGTQIANSVAFLTLLEKGEEIIVETPTYQPLLKFPRKLGLKVKPFERLYADGFEIQTDELQNIISSKTKALVLTNPHNPSGVFLDEDKMKEIQQILEDRDILLIVDEIFRDFVKNGTSALKTGDNVIVTSSFSKIFGMGGIRVGWIASRNEELIKKIYSMKYDMNLLNSTLSEKLVLKVLENRDTLLAEVRDLTEKNLSMVRGWIEGNKNIEWVPPSSGIISFPKLKLPCDSYEFSKRALEEGILVSPGGFFSKGCDDHIRLCFGMETQKLALGLQKLAKVIRTWV